MRTITYRQALYEALQEEMQSDPNVILLGEDIAEYGGAFGVTKDLWKLFGKERVINAPISENSFVGAACGMALLGMRPVVEIMFMDFITLAADQIINHAAKLPFMYAGQVKLPLVIRTPMGAGRGYGASHSQSLERLFMGVPGLQMVAPYTCADAKGLLKAAIRQDSPVLFIEHKLLYAQEGVIPDGQAIPEFGKAAVLKEGKDLTIISYSRMLDLCLEAAAGFAGEADIEVLDLRSLRPLDMETIAASVCKTGKVVFVEEGPVTGGIGAEVCASIAEKCLEYLNGRIVRVGCEDSPIPSSRALEEAMLPNTQKIAQAVRKALAW